MLPTRDMSPPKPLLHVPYGYVMAVEFSLPVIALSLCATLGYYLHFEGVTATHCRVSLACYELPVVCVFEIIRLGLPFSYCESKRPLKKIICKRLRMKYL